MWRAFGIRDWRRLSVGAVIAALLIAAVAPLAVVNLVLVWEARDEAVERRGVALRSSALHAAAQHEVVLRTIDAALAIEPATLAAVIGDRTACDGFLSRRIVEHPFISAALVISRQGRVLCSATGQAVGLDLSDRTYFRNALAHPGLVIDEPVNARPSGQIVLPVARRLDGFLPTHGAGEEPAMIATAFDLDAFVRSVRGAGEPGLESEALDTEIWVVDRSGRVIADLHDPSRKGSRAPFADSLQRLVSMPHVVDGFGGERLLAAASPRLQGGVHLVIGQRFQDVVAAPDRRLATSAVTGLLALLMGLGIAYLLVKRLLLDPLVSLQEMALRLERGDSAITPVSRPYLGELEALRQSFSAMAQGVLMREHRLRTQSQRLTDLAHRDPLTGVANRRALDDSLEMIWTAARARGEPVSVLFLDVDHFKAFNDRYGHHAGDETLKKVAKALSTLPLRAHDLVARYGGEEFVLVLPGANVTGALAVAEQAREAVERLAIQHEGSPIGVVTVSVGAATGCPEAGGGMQRLLARADAALYAAKQTGRNHVRHAETEDAGLV